jgi:hypothetical protein
MVQTHDTKIHVPPDLKAWLAARAKEHVRSVNGEILSILKDAKDREGESKQASKPKSQTA